MGRAPYSEKLGLNKGLWTSDEDKILVDYIQKNGYGRWRAVPKQAGLLRCGKSCRLRWLNYLRPDIKRGRFSPEEERSIIQLHAILGNRWSTIASQLPGRTDNDVKNFWNTHLKKKLLRMGLDPSTHAPRSETNTEKGSQGSQSSALMRHMSQWENARLEAEARLSRESTSFRKLMGNDDVEVDAKAPTDVFLKLWNSEAGKAFRKEAITNNNGDNPHGRVDHNQEHALSWTDTTLQLKYNPHSSLCSGCSFHHLHMDQPNQDNLTDWIGKAQSNDSFSADMPGAQTENNKSTHYGNSSCDKLVQGHDDHNHDIQSWTDLLLDIPNNSTVNNNNNLNNITSMMTGLSTRFQQQSAWPWQELRLDEDKHDWNNVLN